MMGSTNWKSWQDEFFWHNKKIAIAATLYGLVYIDNLVACGELHKARQIISCVITSTDSPREFFR